MSIVYLMILAIAVIGMAAAMYSVYRIRKIINTPPEDKKDKKGAVGDWIVTIAMFIIGVSAFVTGSATLYPITKDIILIQTIGVEVRKTLEDFTPDEIAKVMKAAQEAWEKTQQ